MQIRSRQTVTQCDTFFSIFFFFAHAEPMLLLAVKKKITSWSFGSQKSPGIVRSGFCKHRCSISRMLYYTP